MARFSGEDRLTAIVAQAMPAILPSSDLKRWKRVDHAIDHSGYVQAEAVQVLGSILATALLDDNGYNNASTTTYMTCIETVISLPAGTWRLIVEAQSRGGLTVSTNIDYRLSIDGTTYGTISRSAPTTSAAPFFTNAVIEEMDGNSDVSILVEFKPASAATATINDSTLKILGLRIR